MDTSPASRGTRYGVPALREQINTHLGDAYGQNMLDQREFERRLELAQRAETIEELRAIVADFGPDTSVPWTPSEQRGRRHTHVMSSHHYTLDPGVEDSYRGLSIMGGTVLDLRAFRGSGATLVITLSGCMAEYKVKVPKGTRLVRETHLVMGEYRLRSAVQPGVLKSVWRKLVGVSDPPPPSPYALDGPPPTVILRGTLVVGTLLVSEES